MALSLISFHSSFRSTTATTIPLSPLHSPRSCGVPIVSGSSNRRGVVLGAALGLGSWELWAAGGMVAATGILMASNMDRMKQQDMAMECVSRGMKLFSQGDVEGSLDEFDKALDLDPDKRPYLWQRGLSLYYLNRFEEGANQFRDDVYINPNDTEEAIWCFLCEAQLYGVDEARKRFLQVGLDKRQVLRKVYELFRDGGDPEMVLGQFDDDGGQATFYCLLYKGLFYEAEKNVNAAKAAITSAAKTIYGSRSSDYMALLAKVHCTMRGWQLTESRVALVE